MSIDQIVIAVVSAIAFCMSHERNSTNVKKYACALGMFSQPFWLYSTYINELYGMLFSSVIWTYGWWAQIKTHWFTDEQQ